MSDLQSKMAGIKFSAVAERPSPRLPGQWTLLIGVVYPLVVIAVELGTHMCAEAFFDPMPTYPHVLAVAFVPLCNLFLWRWMHTGDFRKLRWLAVANGMALAIAGFYALLFLPLLPAALLGIIFGIGLLPLAPLASFVCALRLRAALGARHMHQSFTRPRLVGLAMGLTVLFVLDIPAAATRLGVQWAASAETTQRERGLSLLRTFGDDDLLLRLCYGTMARPSGPLHALVLLSGQNLWDNRQGSTISPDAAREVYYRAYGVPFTAVAAPFQEGKRSRLADFQFDADHGGTQVGGRLKALNIVSSRIDGSISGDDAVAYLEWTVEIRNTGAIPRESRLQLALPPGGVVSRATLWINGEEREAAYGGRSEVRAAYQRVAVQQRQDPLLVTTKGGDRILAQAFLVPANGGTIKFKLGITAPLDLTEPSNARLVLPAIVDRNFSFGADVRHDVWIESKQPVLASAPDLTASRTASGAYRVSGSIDDRALSWRRPTIRTSRDAAAVRRVARLDEGDAVMQEVTSGVAPSPAVLMLVIDGSARVKSSIPDLIAALDAIPATAKVGAMVAADPIQQIQPGLWSDAQKQNVVGLLRTAQFVGGQDNAPALASTLRMLEAYSNARIVWVHGPQPINFRGSAALLEQATSRLQRLPDVTLYSVEPGPNEVLPDAPWAWSARLLPRTAAPAADLSAFFAQQASTLAVRREQTGADGGFAKGSDHIARLWAKDRVLSLMRTDPAGNRAAAVLLATQYRLVTPVSGAVVLEIKQQYDESRLTPVSQATVPTIPEPHEWTLAFLACMMLAWFIWHQRQQGIRGAA